MCWYSPRTHLRCGAAGAPDQHTIEPGDATYRPWYADQFPSIEAVASYWNDHYAELRARTKTFTDTFYDSTLPPEVVDAVACNLSILKSPTVLRQADEKFWAWEGTSDDVGSCPGSCTHVWNYQQAVPHLFPELNAAFARPNSALTRMSKGTNNFARRFLSSDRELLPRRRGWTTRRNHEDLSGVAHRRSTEWLRGLWPKVRKSLDYCVETWDPKHKGWIEEPHHNTYDIEFWGPTGMCTSIYLGALHAAVLMGTALGDDVTLYNTLYESGRKRMEAELFNGEYFIQKIEWKNLRAKNPAEMRDYGGSTLPKHASCWRKKAPNINMAPAVSLTA